MLWDRSTAHDISYNPTFFSKGIANKRAAANLITLGIILAHKMFYVRWRTQSGKTCIADQLNASVINAVKR